ncbi:MAG: hypothetical protein V2I35_03535 [Desulfocapsaceae bacterium]|jgi:hypothetical protein|nr:hypothetical protein [Desulfocapsaceae bacterium]
METLIEELKAVIPLKSATDTGDIVLIVGQNPQMIIYGIITSIERDPSKKDEWWNIGITFLTVPLQKVVWTLRTEQMTGREIFTMGGEKRFFQAVELDRGSFTFPSTDKESRSSKRSKLKRVK